jgi:hypothetical protein
MFYILLAIAASALLYAVKGGQHGTVRRYIAARAGLKFDSAGEPYDMSITQAVLWRVLDGKIVSSVGFGILTLNPVAGLCWLIGVAPSIGEEIGAIGGYKGNWRDEGQLWGWKRGVIRGVFLGALLALAMPAQSTALIVAGAAFPAAYFAGVSIGQARTGKTRPGWRLAEWIYGAVIGAAVAFQT